MSEFISAIAMVVFYLSMLVCYLTSLIVTFNESDGIMFAIDLLIPPVGIIHGCLILIGVA
tara:strand:- start:1905 stop:2084 length:180 start_codon:yes stop_codon:yes gene_type:complete